MTLNTSPSSIQLSFAREDDAPAILAILANPAMAKYSPVDDISEKDFRQLLKANPRSFREVSNYYRLLAKTEQQIVGTVLVKCEDPGRNQVEIGYGIKASRQSQGLGRKMVAAACQQIFADSGFSIIWAKVHKNNSPSIRILAGLGFAERWLEPCGEILVYCLEKRAQG